MRSGVDPTGNVPVAPAMSPARRVVGERRGDDLALRQRDEDRRAACSQYLADTARTNVLPSPVRVVGESEPRTKRVLLRPASRPARSRIAAEVQRQLVVRRSRLSEMCDPGGDGR